MKYRFLFKKDPDLKTLKEWNEAGFWVSKGSKARRFDQKGKALFSRSQVQEAPDFYQDEEYEDWLWK